MNSSALSFPYGSTLTSIRDYWKIIALTRWSFVGNWYSSEQRGGPYPGEGDSQPKGTYKLWGQNKSRAMTWCRSIFRLWWSSKILLPFSKNNFQKVKHMIPSKYMSDACIKILLNSFMRVSVWCYNQFKGDFEEFFFLIIRQGNLKRDC